MHTNLELPELNDKNQITSLVEKPIKSKSNLAIVGLYKFTPAVFLNTLEKYQKAQEMNMR